MRTRAAWTAAALVAACCCISSEASAQSFNVDVGGESAPSDAFSGASGRKGRWVVVPAGAPAQPWPLVDVDGRTTPVTVMYTQGQDVEHDEPSTTEDFEALLDDFQRFSNPNSWAISGLRAGFYQVFTYSWSPDRPLEGSTRIEVVGSGEGEQEVGCAEWNGSLVEGEQYSRHHVMLGAGDVLQIELEAGSGGFGAVNALQLLHVPVPGASGRAERAHEPLLSAALRVAAEPGADLCPIEIEPAQFEPVERLARNQDGTGLTSERAVRGRPHGGTAAGLAPPLLARTTGPFAPLEPARGAL